MRRTMLLLTVALGLAGCKSQAPTADPFTNHPIVPPPGTGACPLPNVDPGYLPNRQITQPPPNQLGLPAAGQPAPGIPPAYSNLGSPPPATPGGAWMASGTSGQNSAPSSMFSAPPASDATSGVTAPGTSGLLQPNSNGAPSGTTIPTIPAGGNPANGNPPATSPAGNNPGYGTPGYGASGYGASNSTAAPGTTPTTGSPALGMASPYIIPPPGTAPTGYPNSVANPTPAVLNTSAVPSPAGMPNSGSVNPANPGNLAATNGASASPLPTGNRYGTSAAANNFRNAPTTPNTPILGTPRPTSTLGANSIARPAAASIPGTPLDTRSPRPLDDTVQPIQSPVAPNPGVPANSTTATNSISRSNRTPVHGVPAAQATAAMSPMPQPRVMPIAPTAYANPLANPPYCASIQTIVVEPDWQPCDGYADEGE